MSKYLFLGISFNFILFHSYSCGTLFLYRLVLNKVSNAGHHPHSPMLMRVDTDNFELNVISFNAYIVIYVIFICGNIYLVEGSYRFVAHSDLS
jgi:hypothetical protein